MPHTIGGNGDERGSNSYAVFKALFDEAEYTYNNAGDFKALLQNLINGTYSKIVLPIKNNLIGEVLPVKEAWDEMITPDIQLIEEQQYDCLINHALIGGPNASLESLIRVYGYPVATNQCRQALDKLGKDELFHPDTYGAVVDIIERNMPNEAAVGPYEAAEREGGKILIENLSDNPNNITTFKVYSLK